MIAGLSQYRIGRYSDGSDCTERKNVPRVYLDLPNANDELAVATYHNRLMMLCKFPFTLLSQKCLERCEVQGPVQAAGPADPEELAIVPSTDSGAPSQGTNRASFLSQGSS